MTARNIVVRASQQRRDYVWYSQIASAATSDAEIVSAINLARSYGVAIRGGYPYWISRELERMDAQENHRLCKRMR